MRRLGLTLEEEQEVAVDDLAKRVAVWARKMGLTVGQLLERVGEALAVGPPLSPEDKEQLRAHGITPEEFAAVQKNDGGKSYRELKAREKRGAAA